MKNYDQKVKCVFEAIVEEAAKDPLAGLIILEPEQRLTKDMRLDEVEFILNEFREEGIVNWEDVTFNKLYWTKEEKTLNEKAENYYQIIFTTKARYLIELKLSFSKFHYEFLDGKYHLLNKLGEKEKINELNWSSITIKFLSGEDIEITTPQKTYKADFKQIEGFLDKRSPIPKSNQQWNLLKCFAENKGEIPAPIAGSAGSQVVQRLAKALRRYFKITEYPFETISHQRSNKCAAKFHIESY